MTFMDQLLSLMGLKGGNAKGKGKGTGKSPSFTPSGMEANPVGVILMTELEGARGLAEQLTGILEQVNGLVLDRVTRPLKLPNGGTLAARLSQAAVTGRTLLKNSDGDLLVFGEGGEQGIVLRFVHANPSGDSGVGTFGLGDSLEIPAQLDSETAALFIASVITALDPARDKARYTDLLVQASDQVGAMSAQMPASLTDRQKATALIALGHVYGARAKLGRQKDAWIQRSLSAFSQAAEVIDPKAEPLLWAISQSHHANGLLATAESQKDMAAQERAAGLFREITQTLTAIEYPSDWALAQVRLGTTLYKLGTKGGETKKLKEAASAFEAALTVQTRDSAAQYWAEIMNQYGVCLLALGQHVQGTKALEQSVQAFRSALEVRRRETLPLLWAQTANNLGAAAFALAKRGGPEGALAEAEACFQGAREVFLENGKVRVIEVIDKNLDRVRHQMGIRKS